MQGTGADRSALDDRRILRFGGEDGEPGAGDYISPRIQTPATHARPPKRGMVTSSARNKNFLVTDAGWPHGANCDLWPAQPTRASGNLR
jgi:hypothetical protein